MKHNKVSVIMGIYNCAETLGDAIDSILAQTYDNWELIMCDDGSIDRTYEIAQKYAQENPEKIILLRNSSNQSLAFSLNRCLQCADGEFVARMDGDDISAPERFAIQVSYLRNNPQISLVGTAMQRFNKNGPADIVYTPEHPDRNTMKIRTPFNHATIMAYQSVFSALNGYTVSERTRRCEDLELWFRFFSKGFAGANLQDALYFVREDENAVARRTGKSRIDALLITYDGYKMLGFPWYCKIQPTVSTALKICVPTRIVLIYRFMQKKNPLHRHQ